MKRLSIIVFSLMAIVAKGQSAPEKDLTSRKQHNFLLSGSAIQYMNKQDVSLYSGDKHFLSAANTSGYQFGLGYEYVNKYNISYTVSFSYGMQPISLAWDFSFKNFDPEVDLSDGRLWYSYYKKSNFLNSSFLLGYDYHNRKLKNTIIQLKAGLGSLNRLHYDVDDRVHLAEYDVSSNHTRMRKFAATYTMVGVPNGWQNDLAPYYNFYLGVKRPIKSNFLKDYRIGVTFTRAIMTFHGTQAFDVNYSTYYNSKGEIDGGERYDNMFRSFALTGTLTF